MTGSARRTSEATAPEVPGLKFRMLADRLRREIGRGVWPAGSRLPTEPELARAHQASVSTVRRAVAELVAEELVVRRQGSGTYVLPPKPASGCSALVGVVVPNAAFYYPRVLQGIEEELTAAGARSVVACSGYDQVREIGAVAEMLDIGADGLLIAPTLIGPEPPEAYLARIAGIPVPAVLVERRGTSLGDTTESVCTHHEAGGYDAVRHLVRLGHRMIGLVLRIPSPTAEPVGRGFHQAIHELGLPSTEFQAALEEWSPAAADRCLAGLRRAGATAAVCFGDRQAALLAAAARRHGMRVPDDLALVAYDDEIADIAEIPLTAVAPPKHLLGRTAAALLLNRLEHPEESRRQVLLRPAITVRDSCGAARERPAPGLY
ncbi:LacI family transcriptional regulator [Kitasatospora sp. NBC_00240]|uniref:GntR family transcriptional regulator n=1 Tax=Kitasatospora sp. NBC_00240 TaxID=2903567 RepID=UPI00225A7551|nr:LacI family DNA-binding transcriptional regulator [Kitasatospora sp. NBC_00240]MCX5208412.1 LacI family transcriptional regulator [Kitasatospora sp. NBC_00240]